MSIGFNTCKCKVKYSRQPCLFINSTKKLKYFSITESKYVRVFFQSIRSVYANSQQVTCPWDIVRFSFFFSSFFNSYFTSQTIFTNTFMKILWGLFSISLVWFSLLPDFFPQLPYGFSISFEIQFVPFLIRIFFLKISFEYLHQNIDWENKKLILCFYLKREE